MIGLALWLWIGVAGWLAAFVVMAVIVLYDLWRYDDESLRRWHETQDLLDQYEDLLDAWLRETLRRRRDAEQVSMVEVIEWADAHDHPVPPELRELVGAHNDNGPLG